MGRPEFSETERLHRLLKEDVRVSHRNRCFCRRSSIAMGTLTKKVWWITCWLGLAALTAEAAEGPVQETAEAAEDPVQEYLPYVSPVTLATEVTPDMPALPNLPGLDSAPEGFTFGESLTIDDPSQTFFECEECYGDGNGFKKYRENPKNSGCDKVSKLGSVCKEKCPMDDDIKLKFEADTCQKCCTEQVRFYQGLLDMNSRFLQSDQEKKRAADDAEANFQENWGKMVVQRELTAQKCTDEMQYLEAKNTELLTKASDAANRNRLAQQLVFDSMLKQIIRVKQEKDLEKLQKSKGATLRGKIWRAHKARGQTRETLKNNFEICKDIANAIHTLVNEEGYKQKAREIEVKQKNLDEVYAATKQQYVLALQNNERLAQEALTAAKSSRASYDGLANEKESI